MCCKFVLLFEVIMICTPLFSQYFGSTVEPGKVLNPGKVEPLDINGTDCKYLLMTDNNSSERALLKEAHDCINHNVVCYYGSCFPMMSDCCLFSGV